MVGTLDYRYGGRLKKCDQTLISCCEGKWNWNKREALDKTPVVVAEGNGAEYLQRWRASEL
jgi:hypothetical protein